MINYKLKYYFRLVGIVLAKSLLYGIDVETQDLYDWKTSGFKKEIPCSINSFRTLINLCIHSHISTEFINVFATSMILHFPLNEFGEYNKNEAEEWMKEFYSNPTFKTIQNLGKLSPLNLFTAFNSHWGDQQNSVNNPLSLLISSIKQDESCIKLYQILSNFKND